MRIGTPGEPHTNSFTVEITEEENPVVHRSNWKGGRKHKGNWKKDQWDAKEFIAWDGEGLQVNVPLTETFGRFVWEDRKEIVLEHQPEEQPYVLLSNSKGQSIQRQEGLGTKECLEFLLNTKQQFKESIFVGFGFDYDINQIIKDLELVNLWNLHDHNKCYWEGYHLRWFPKKYFTVSHRRSKRSCTIYDTFSFFQRSFLVACQDYLGKDDPDLNVIKEGKEHRSEFTWEELDDFIIPYNNMELSMMVRLMNILRKDLHEAGIHPGRWYGPGAVANKVLAQYNIPIARDIPEEILDASQYAYAGGRFELFYMGRYAAPVYQYDIRSAYPSALAKLPDISDGTWEHVSRFEPATFGVWYIERRGKRSGGPQPLFCRSKSGSVSYPYEVQGWYWTPEAELCPNDVTEGYVFHPGSSRLPFDFIEDMYTTRQAWKRDGVSAERALKLVLNSLYGKLAQRIGGKDGPPKWHQLEYAGYITSFTRAKIYRACMLNPGAILATETDAVFSMEPLELPLSENLGDWELTEFDEITYLQSGFYYAHEVNTPPEKIVCKYRGMDRDRNTGQPVGLPYGVVLDHLRYDTGQQDWPSRPLRGTTQRFIGIGPALSTSAVWRTWERKSYLISLDHSDGSYKRIHIASSCDLCKQGISMYDQLHPLEIGGYSGQSYARALKWREVAMVKEGEFIVDWTMDTEFLDMEDEDRWSGN